MAYAESVMARVNSKIIPIMVFIAISYLMLAQFQKFLSPKSFRLGSTNSLIVPGATWTSSNTGRHIQAHGGGFIKVDDTFYWIGEDKSNGTWFQHINCYSSRDLVHWTFIDNILSREENDGDLGRYRIAERPKVIYNHQTKTYVMYVHIDDELYQEAKVGVAISKTGVCDQYQYLGSFRPLDQISRDLGLFQDEDGKAYLLTEDRPNGLHIHQLSADYTKIEKNIHTFPEHLESPALVYLPHIGHYIIFASHLTGWNANDNVYSFATSLKGPWSEWKTFAVLGTKTFQTQISFALPIGISRSSNEGFVIYMGDRWDPFNLMRSTYVWQPLTIGFENDDAKNLKVSMENHRIWNLNLKSALWEDQDALGSDIYQAEVASMLGDAKIVSCSLCTGGKAVQIINANGVRFDRIISSASATATILLHYLMDGYNEQFGQLWINDEKSEAISFLPSGNFSTDGMTFGTFMTSATIHVNSGKNVIEIRGVQGINITLDSIEIART